MEHKKEKGRTITFEIEGTDGFKKSIMSNCCCMLALNEDGIKRLLNINAPGTDVIRLYCGLMEVKEKLESVIPTLPALYASGKFGFESEGGEDVD